MQGQLSSALDTHLSKLSKAATTNKGHLQAVRSLLNTVVLQVHTNADFDSADLNGASVQGQYRGQETYPSPGKPGPQGAHEVQLDAPLLGLQSLACTLKLLKVHSRGQQAVLAW